MDKILLKYTEYNEPHESLTNKNIIDVSTTNVSTRIVQCYQLCLQFQDLSKHDLYSLRNVLFSYEVVGYTECSILSPKGKGNLEITFSVGLDKQQY